MDFIHQRPVKGTIALIVFDGRAGGSQDAFRLFQRFPFMGIFRQRERRQVPVYLFRIENMGETHNRPIQIDMDLFRLAVFPQDRIAVLIHFIFFPRPLIKHHGRGFTPGLDLIPRLLCLFICHPPGIVIAGQSQPNPVHPPVNRAGNGIMRRNDLPAVFPRFLPRRGPFFQAFYDFFRKLYMERGTFGLVILHRLHPPER